MTVMNFEEMVVVEGGRFLGWGWHTESKDPVDYHMADCNGCAGYIAHQSYDVFGIGTGITRDIVVCLKGCI
jgi:hypothetical protein